MRLRTALLSLLLTLGSSLVWPQGTTSRITGIVKDKSGAVIAGAAVTVTNEGTNTAFRTSSGPGGVYVVDSLLQSLQSSVFTRLNQASDGVLVNSPRRMQLSLKYTF